MIATATDTHHSGVAKTRGWLSLLRILLADIPLVILFGLLCAAVLLEHVYWSYVTPIVQSYKRDEMIGDFHDDYANDFTYYNRHCGPDDISTTSAADLLILEEYNGEEAANVMLKHGAVAFQNVLQNDTATNLRAYLLDKHHNKDKLGYNEVFWDEISRMSLGIGTSDDPVIADALKEVGTHPVIKRTLEGILGPDPAIVEVSTLTSLNGASAQGIHTDSDWFGSSLLYSRNFLHSYSLFVALQDTSQDLGATTVCPGTHYCADPDLEELCLEHGAFEISTNGHTGEDGMFHKGDAFLFNQNIWHRGPENVDPDGLDRFMFIMTFASAKDVAEDRRRQGLGTYYYQRYNIWGSTYSMLKDATTTMIQPFAVFRALGLVKTRGITWIHHFCQQLSNGDEFYDDGELYDLKEKVFDFYKVPEFLQSTSESWEEFIPETVSLWIKLLSKANAVAITIYCVACAIVRLAAPSRGSQLPKSLVLSLGSVALTAVALSKFIDQTELAQSVTTGDVFAKPFPLVSEDTMDATAIKYGPTTFPERNDVLITTRFDADFLGNFNRFVDYHPGNVRWENMVAAAAFLPDNMVSLAAGHVVRDTLQSKESGLHSRFLWQNPHTGTWSALSRAAAVQETRRALMEKRNPLVAKIARGLRRLLADARFGSQHGTAMARIFVEAVEPYWSANLYGENEIISEPPKSSGARNHAYKIDQGFSNMEIKRTLLATRPATRQPTLERFLARGASSSSENDSDEDEDDDIDVGDKVWVYYGGPEWYEAELVDVLDEERCVVFLYNSGDNEVVHPEDLKEYVQFREGDRVEVDYHRNSKEFFAGTITNMHPDGRCSVEYDDGESQDKIGREYLVAL